jgi:hypothetical protein
MPQRQGNVPALGRLERVGRGRLGRGEHLAEARQLEIGQGKVQQEGVEAGEADRRGGGRPIRRRHRMVPGRAQHPQEGVSAHRIVLEHQQMHRAHVLKLLPMIGAKQTEPS